ncbi:hypothetical protein BDM02DRAFT_2901205 [Thelephora ganbajun]|uniref:Uncharacterized protein n=1 Tax=Thelephora ganbajun TaxID=370292 RepID=A0ACB6ZT08_THEGA|nr:hypothetical protein BDM02DRAFT_2901205 [Thelephora ganbajun]
MPPKSKSHPKRTATAKRGKRRDEPESEGEGYSTSAAEDDVQALDSDNLDDDAEMAKQEKKKGVKRKKDPSPIKRRKRRKKAGSEEEESDLELKEGQVVVGKIVRAPKTGQVPPGQISQNTFDFLNQLKEPECNDREWFKLNGPVFRQAEKEWKAFTEVFTDHIVEADPQIPHLPPKDVVHRIYRDIRFSNDKTPYKTNFSASFSRSGRKVKPGNGSIIAAGAWCPGKNELQTIRNNLQRSSARLRQIISSTEFTKLFGEARPHPQGERRNIFGGEDELKVAPKGVDKNHPDIDLLKCRSFAVIHRIADEVVLGPDFVKKLKEFVVVLRPFVHCLNDMMTIQDPGEESSEGEGDDEDAGDDEDE